MIDLYGSNGNFTQNGTSYLVAGADYNFSCVVPSIRPGAEFNWTLGSQEITSHISNDSVAADGLTTSTSVVTVTATWTKHGQILECSASNYDDFIGVSAGLTLDVKVPPTRSSMSIYDAKGTRLGQTVDVDQGASYNFTCVVQGTRPAATIEWFLDDVLHLTASPPSGIGDGLVETTDTLAFTPNRSMHGQRVMCKASTPESQDPFPSVVTELNVNVLPAEISLYALSENLSFTRNDTLYVIAGVEGEFTCEVPNIDPGASFTWYLGSQTFAPNVSTDALGPDGLLTSTSKFTLSPTWSNQEEFLRCHASNKVGYPGLSVSVMLDVKVPPRESSLSLVDSDGLRLGSVVDVVEGNPKTLTCMVQGTRPAASVQWFLADVLQSVVHPSVDQVEGLFNVTSNWTITPNKVHHQQIVTCSARTAESQEPFPSVSVSLNVSVFPTEVILLDSTGNFTSNDTVYLVDGVDYPFICAVPDINPGAWFTWTLGNQRLSSSSNDTTGTSGLLTSTSQVFITPSWDNQGMILQCRATNRESYVGISMDIWLDIKVPPDSSSILLYNESRTPIGTTLIVDQGSAYNIRCEVQGTRPAAIIQWFLNGTLQRTAYPRFKGDDGLVNTSDTWWFRPTRANHRHEVKCVASTPESKEPLPSKALTLEVNGPPDTPVIMGDTTMTEAVASTLTCFADQGFPDKWTLHWSYGDLNDIANLTTTPSGSGSRFLFNSSFTVTPTREDNGKTVTCSAREDSWVVRPTTTFGPLNVKFCPRQVSITNCPIKAIPGTIQSFNCVSESSNPLTNLTWFRDGVPLTNPAPPVLSDGEHLGHVTVEDFATGVLIKEDNGALFTCCAGQTTSCTAEVCDSCTLNVEYRPFFSDPTTSTPSPVREGDDVVLSCSADANPLPPGFITWQKVGSPTSLSSVYSAATSILTLRSVSREQAGPYRCRGDNGVPPVVFSNAINVSVYYGVNITNKADNYVGAAAREVAVLVCQAEGNPLPLTAWLGPTNEEITNQTEPGRLFRENTITGGDDVYGYDVTSILEIHLVTERDYGLYSCYGGNGVGRVDVLHVLLSNKGEPSPPLSLAVDEDRSTANSVTITWSPGYDGGSAQWFRVICRDLESDDLFDPGRRSDRIQGSYEYTLVGLLPYVVYEVQVYAENPYGASEAVKKIVRTLHSPEFSEPMFITMNPVAEGDDIILSCSADANPRPPGFITWERIGSPDPLPSVYSDGTSTMTLRNIRREQAGPYRCRGNNGVPPVVYSSSVVVIVHYGVITTCLANGYVEANDGENAALTCTATGNPYPLVTWLDPTRTKITNETEPQRIFQVETITGGDVVHGFTITSILSIRNVTGAVDYGLYVCSCGNGVGMVDAMTILLTPRVLPSAPTNVTIFEEENTASSITVSWNSGNEVGNNLWFHVNYRLLETTDDFDPSNRTDRLFDVTSFTMEGLQPYSLYEVEVYAESVNGRSEAVTVIGTTAMCTRMVSIKGCPHRVVSSAIVSLRCVAESTSPATNLTWLRDNVPQSTLIQPVVTDGDYGGRVTAQDITTGALTKADHGTEFKCCAVRPSVCAVDACDKCSLNVEFRPAFYETLVLTGDPVEEGDDVILSCSADANPMPQDFITWEKVGSPDSLPSVYRDGASFLTLSSISRDQAGSYRCQGNNGIPPIVYSSSVDVIVQFGVTIISQDDVYVEANVGESAVLICSAKSNPKPIMTWLSPAGTRITNQTDAGRIVLVDTIPSRGGLDGYVVTSALQINNVTGPEDYGFYVCGSGNGIGLVDTLNIMLNNRVEPEPPHSFFVDETRTTANSLTVTWIPAERVFGPTQWFYVNYRELSSAYYYDSATESIKLYDAIEYTLVGLRPDTAYEVEVYAENANGASDTVKTVGNTLPEEKETTSSLYTENAIGASDVTRTTTTTLRISGTTPVQLAEKTNSASDLLESTTTTFSDPEHHTAAFGEQVAERRSDTDVKSQESTLVTVIIVIAIVAFFCLVIIVSGFLYHRRSMKKYKQGDAPVHTTCHCLTFTTKLHELHNVLCNTSDTLIRQAH
ncbi:hemicentin-1-like [Acanthaster planci]|uniref:Hemicentin-1-like n=1 Tax=Acanthaster planci TaxID=133434 RepID=A0A8B7ZV53_ACAPL|nr:hemicentin-1-like [Acanthaster planci]